ncbi:amino acid/polyamine transporter I [Elsinoe ampelina]|uniref:Amino acid/polyamine transporter I n=1 Tax=Elsinoe ampelina TaxID=302913 RepID=A0A6A6GJ42_9PEZI|nr:amino acid/polyamine transporter I [Elsinoe ampelina]
MTHATGTAQDRDAMNRMGKTQELMASWNLNGFAIFGYSLVLGNAWVVAIITSIFGLTNGGTAGIIWSFIVVLFGMFCSTLSMAEMASMAPTAGCQYHWVSEFAPPRAQKILSYLVGWMCVLGWQTAMAASAYTPALAPQGLIAINNPTYTLAPYQAYLFTVAILLVSILINIFLIRKFKPIETAMVIFFFLSWISISSPSSGRRAKKAPARQVFTSFSDGSGWGSLGLATLIGGLTAAHLSEELVDSSYALPRAMVLTALANYLTATVAVITLCFTLGGSAEDLLETRYGQPYIQVLYNAVRSRGDASVLAAVVTVLLLFTSINQVATTSRQLYAFARDDGFPFSGVLKKVVNPMYNIPVNSLFATFMFTFLFGLIVLGSNVAFNILTTLSSSGLLTSYIVCIGCILHKRVTRPNELPPSRFSLGRFVVAVNIVALSLLAVIFVFLFFPPIPRPAPAEMNWTVLIYGVTLVGCLVFYMLVGRHRYQAPVALVKKEY